MTNPTITLGAKQFEVPTLAIAQIREIDWRIIRSGQALIDRTKITQQARDDFYDIAYAALQRTQPAMTRDEFDALGATLVEVMNAIPVIVTQTNLFKPAAEAPQTTGEASTGTAS